MKYPGRTMVSLFDNLSRVVAKEKAFSRWVAEMPTTAKVQQCLY